MQTCMHVHAITHVCGLEEDSFQELSPISLLGPED